MNSFPAEPGTWLIDLDPDVEPIPIIGWAVSGVCAAPILPIHADPVSGQAYRLPGTGAVVDPAWSRTFESDDAWRAAAGRKMPYEPGVSLLFGTEPAKANKPKPASAAKPSAAPKEPAEGSEELAAEVAAQLEWGKKQLKNNSFWHFTGTPEAVFIMPGGKTLPVGDDVEKITRDKFYELRKELTEVSIDPDNLPEQDEPEVEDDDDDDDAGGLV